mmetsp:Transcript_14460/g.21900  ORF Transcript_14460/g.21900 Transcript_14460/m.21900 type:complete len:208 (-) Transcript_14460:1835-2458(-)
MNCYFSCKFIFHPRTILVYLLFLHYCHHYYLSLFLYQESFPFPNLLSFYPSFSLSTLPLSMLAYLWFQLHCCHYHYQIYQKLSFSYHLNPQFQSKALILEKNFHFQHYFYQHQVHRFLVEVELKQLQKGEVVNMPPGGSPSVVNDHPSTKHESLQLEPILLLSKYSYPPISVSAVTHTGQTAVPMMMAITMTTWVQTMRKLRSSQQQ